MHIKQDVFNMLWVYGKTLATGNAKEQVLDPIYRPNFSYQVDESGFEILCICKVKDIESKGQAFMSI